MGKVMGKSWEIWEKYWLGSATVFGIFGSRDMGKRSGFSPWSTTCLRSQDVSGHICENWPIMSFGEKKGLITTTSHSSSSSRKRTSPHCEYIPEIPWNHVAYITLKTQGFLKKMQTRTKLVLSFFSLPKSCPQANSPTTDGPRCCKSFFSNSLICSMSSFFLAVSSLLQVVYVPPWQLL